MGVEARPGTPQDARKVIDSSLAGVETTIDSLLADEVGDRIKGKNLDFFPTRFPGFYLLVASGDEAADLRRSDETTFRRDLRLYFLRDQFIKRLEMLQAPVRERMIRTAIANKRHRGGRDETIGAEVQLNPTFHINVPLAEEGLGKVAGEYIHRKTVISFELDPETDDVGGIKKAVKAVLKRRGKNPDSVKQSETLRIDRDDLLTAARKGEISLIPGTISLPTELGEWKAVPRSILALPEIDEAISLSIKNSGLDNPDDLTNSSEE